MTTLTAPLVGVAFRQGGKAILAVLPSGAPLTVQREPTNAYDPDAVAVFVSPAAIPESQLADLRDSLGPAGIDFDEFLDGPDFHLGYVANSEKTGGKHASAWSQRLLALAPDEPASPFQASLSFDIAGKPVATLTFPEA